MKSIAQIRAQYALSKVDEIRSNYNELNNKNYKSFVAGCPTMILQNGLGQALAFWAAKSKLNVKKKEGQILEVIRGWFREPDNQLKLDSINCKDFIEKLMQKNQNEFVLFQKETLLMLEWYKRYVNAFLDDKEAATNGED
ncbi:MAG TPA: type III-B CRISPR module-associated protein Cmr5 [Candidatus Cloacimonas sp.]|nr:type III-B CRISPR module-associated protein Cmr5 [Candidatus Cloacimonas sp.]